MQVFARSGAWFVRGEAALFESDWNGVHGGALGLLKECLGAQGGLWLEACGKAYAETIYAGTRQQAHSAAIGHDMPRPTQRNR